MRAPFRAGRAHLPDYRQMDISRAEQRILHLLAQGGRIETTRQGKKLAELHCYSRDGWRFAGLDEHLFRKLKRKRAIASKGGAPYRITRRGLELGRAELDNR